MTGKRVDDGKSFSLTKKAQARGARSTVPDPLLSWEEQAYERLKVLYAVGKLLSRAESLENIFPNILNLCALNFPFVTGILIEKRSKSTTTSIWHADNVTPDLIESAMLNAKMAFDFLTGVSKSDSYVLDGIRADNKVPSSNRQNYIAIPLVVDGLPAFGIVQLDGSIPLNEKDLEFVDALANLIAVAIDRHYKSEMEREARIREVAAKTSKLSETEAYVTDLENERELREKFVSLLTHDLRTPLSAAKISAQLIQRQGEISEMSQALAARIVTNVARADQMITDLLDANRIRGGEKLPLHPEHVELNSLIKETLQELATIHGDRFVLKNDQVVNGYWDRKSLMRIVENLCNNAVKYGCPQSPITICLTSHDDFAIISVQNFGDLISSTDQKTLFRQFRRTQSAHGSRKKGWGIGLTLVRGVAEAHGGSVALASEKEAGTIFTVSLPLDSRPFLQKEVK